ANALLAHGSDVNAKTTGAGGGRRGGGGGRGGGGEGQTPLLLAARAGQVRVMRALVKAGADTKVKASDGTTLLLAASASSRLDAIQYAYELDPDVKARTSGGQSVLHLAITNFAGAAAAVQFLADKGADLDTPDSKGMTPLDV